jgi:hypothetical protein
MLGEPEPKVAENCADLGPLANRVVIVWPDADESGLNAAPFLIE